MFSSWKKMQYVLFFLSLSFSLPYYLKGTMVLLKTAVIPILKKDISLPSHSYGIFCKMGNAKNLVSAHNSVFLIKLFFFKKKEEGSSGNCFVLGFWFGKWNIIQSNNEGPLLNQPQWSHQPGWLMMLMNSQSLIKDTKCYSNDLTQKIGNSVFLVQCALLAQRYPASFHA